MNSILLGAVIGALLASAHAHAGDDPRVLLDAAFDGHPVDLPIGDGGADLGEPMHIDPDLSVIVRADPLPTPSLEFSHAATGLARTARFEFLDAEEVSHGDLLIRVTFHAAQLDHFNFYLREPAFSAESFLTLSLGPAGDISVADAAGPVGIIGTYSTNVAHQLLVEYHMDAGTYDIALDDVPLLTARNHGVSGRGIGALLIGTSHQTAPGSLMYVDGLGVERGDGIFSDGFERTDRLPVAIAGDPCRPSCSHRIESPLLGARA